MSRRMDPFGIKFHLFFDLTIVSFHLWVKRNPLPKSSPITKQKVVVAMSGGADSSAVAEFSQCHYHSAVEVEDVLHAIINTAYSI